MDVRGRSQHDGSTGPGGPAAAGTPPPSGSRDGAPVGDTTSQ
jgi:hypothetical protein